MKTILKLAYDGTPYRGFQYQPHQPTVQHELCIAAEAAFGFPCNITGCSRTDSGVHATGFVAMLEAKDPADVLPASIPTGKLPRVMNTHLPPDIAVCAAAVVGDDFHPRYSVKSKKYSYIIYNSPARSPFYKGRALWLPHSLTDDAVSRMSECAERFVGTHDFTSFMAAGSKITDAVRTVISASVMRLDDTVVFTVRADGFLYNMVRIMVGTLLDTAAGKLSPDDISAIIEARERSRAGTTAPPDGLYLTQVYYDPMPEWQCN